VTSGLPEGEVAPGLPGAAAAPPAQEEPVAAAVTDEPQVAPEPVVAAEPVVADEPVEADEPAVADEPGVADEPVAEEPPARSRRRAAVMPPAVLFIPPDPEAPVEPAPARRSRRKAAEPAAVADEPVAEVGADAPAEEQAEATGRRRRRGRGRAEADETPVEVDVEDLEAPDESADDVEDAGDDDLDDEASRRRRRRGRRGRGRGKGPLDDDEDETEEPAAAEAAEADDDEADDDAPDADGVTRRRRRRRRKGAGDTDAGTDDGVHTVVKIREPRTRDRSSSDEVQGVSGSTRLEAKRQRRRDGREQRRTRPPILSESEFLARREAVDRVMVVRQKPDRTQIAVLEDGVLVEHYVARATSGTMVGNVYLGKVQNVLPSMEAAFVDVGRGRNAVLYAGEVNWDVSGLEGRARSIEQALRSGDSVMVQVTKDPIGHKGARLSSHIALSGRHLVYVPHGNASGISRKLPDNERKRLRDALKKLVPDGAGVIVRTAAEGASEEELARDVKRLQAQWEAIQARAVDGNAPALLSEEPDLVVRVVRDLFNEDFRELIIEGEQAYKEVEDYLDSVSPDLVQRLRRHTGVGDVFAEHRIDEQILKALDRKVFLPSGGHLVIDRTEAMTVIDVNTGKYTGAGGNLEETVTRNNLEAAEETVRQLRLRDLGGIVVIDFIDMVLESNRELVLRRLTECLGRDRTKHQVTEITSLGLVQMTRKRIGAGLLEAFSETCEHCKGRGLIMHTEPVPEKRSGGGGGNAAEKVKAVASAGQPNGRPEPSGPAGPANGRSEPVSSRRRGRRGGAAAAAEDVADAVAESAEEEAAALEAPSLESGGPAAPTAATAPVAGSGVIGSAAAPAAPAAAPAEDPYDISGYDLSRYEGDPAEDTEPLAGPDDPDAADDDLDDGDEPIGAGAGSRRRSRRGGARRRTRP
jgi:ribonuclease E